MNPCILRATPWMRLKSFPAIAEAVLALQHVLLLCYHTSAAVAFDRIHEPRVESSYIVSSVSIFAALDLSRNDNGTTSRLAIKHKQTRHGNAVCYIMFKMIHLELVFFSSRSESIDSLATCTWGGTSCERKVS